MDAVFKRSQFHHSPDIESKFRTIIAEQQSGKTLKKKRRRHGAFSPLGMESSRFSSTHTGIHLPPEPSARKLPVISKANILVNDKPEVKAPASPEDIRQLLSKSKIDKKVSNNRSPHPEDLGI